MVRSQSGHFDTLRGSDSRSEYSWSLNELRVDVVAAEVRYIVWSRILPMLLLRHYSDFEGGGHPIILLSSIKRAFLINKLIQ